MWTTLQNDYALQLFWWKLENEKHAERAYACSFHLASERKLPDNYLCVKSVSKVSKIVESP